MAKAKFERTKPHRERWHDLGTWTTARRRLTAALTKVSADKGLATYVSYDQVAKASESQGRRDANEDSDDRDEPRGVFDGERHYAHVDCPGHADYVKNMNHGRRADGRGDPRRQRRPMARCRRRASTSCSRGK